MRSDEPLVLGIETSCDETGIGIVRGTTLLADAIASSVDEHARFGGVVPEVASRAHLQAMVPTIRRALDTAGISAARRRRGRGHGRTRAGRRAARRRRRRQGVRARARQAALRREPPLVPRRGRPARTRAARRAVRRAARVGRALVAAVRAAHRRRRDHRTRRDGRRRGGRGLRQGGPAARVCRSPADRRSTGWRARATAHAIEFPRGMRDEGFAFSFSGLKTAVARWVEARQRSGRAGAGRRRRRQLPGGRRRRAHREGGARRARAGRRAHRHRRRRRGQLAAARAGRGTLRGGRPAAARAPSRTVHRQRRDGGRARRATRRPRRDPVARSTCRPTPRCRSPKCWCR